MVCSCERCCQLFNDELGEGVCPWCLGDTVTELKSNLDVVLKKYTKALQYLFETIPSCKECSINPTCPLKDRETPACMEQFNKFIDKEIMGD